MTNRYKESVGIWEHKLGTIMHNLEPTEEDNLEVSNIVTNAKRYTDDSVMFKKLVEFYIKLVLRTYTDLNDEEKKTLRLACYRRIRGVAEDVLISFGWTTRDELNKVEGDALKKLVSTN